MSVNVTARQEKLAGLVKSATVIPVLTIERLEDAVPLARALVAGRRAHAGSDVAHPGGDRGRQGHDR